MFILIDFEIETSVCKHDTKSQPDVKQEIRDVPYDLVYIRTECNRMY